MYVLTTGSEIRVGVTSTVGYGVGVGDEHWPVRVVGLLVVLLSLLFLRSLVMMILVGRPILAPSQSDHILHYLVQLPGDVIICTVSLIGWLVLMCFHQDAIEKPFIGMDGIIKFVSFINMGHFSYRLVIVMFLPDTCLDIHKLTTGLHYMVAISTQVLPLLTNENRLMVFLALLIPLPHVFHTLYNIYKKQDRPGTKQLVYAALWLLSFVAVSAISLTLVVIAAAYYQDPLTMTNLSLSWFGGVCAYCLCVVLLSGKTAISAVCQDRQAGSRNPERQTVTEETPIISGQHVPLYVGLVLSSLQNTKNKPDKTVEATIINISDKS